MDPSDFLPQLASTFTAKRVYSEPYERDGITVITAAAVRGGGGMRQGGEEGGGMGLSARPVGAYVVRKDRVTWKPVFDLSRIALRGQVVLVAALVVLGLALHRK